MLHDFLELALELENAALADEYFVKVIVRVGGVNMVCDSGNCFQMWISSLELP